MKYTVNTIFKTVEIEQSGDIEISDLISNLKNLEEIYKDYKFTLIAPQNVINNFPWITPIWQEPFQQIPYNPNVPYRNDWYTITCSNDLLSNDLQNKLAIN